ncbi:tRNA pseudouridine(38-40) synthase TruA [Phytoactinopolyspora alkaliphila]|uniref:tRNA pseudouridine synthase A n=1 Tax=Phytoactinopolyspora alkaliphila TaxID=1783498 RepID=A0A6N9YHL6_9ACTN|nr:tRNA pseudouridine(38-40) synthase TruA [Phytoactinopolyspora alkaliphila]NED94420.1 tRNA pseudouridine(38-40) synthase TruA [Phytoactinopolyspora alkaliphila]
MQPTDSAPGSGGLLRVRLDVAYDGTGFSGWAAQPGLRTVQGVLETALGTVLRTEAPRLTVAGRTDSGVHARGQVCHVDLPVEGWESLPGRSDVPPERALVRRLAGLLPDDVRVAAAAVAPDGFDARFSAIWRRYVYRVADSSYGVDPLLRSHILWHDRPLDLAAMNAAAAGLLGEHDFAAYCRARAGATTIRELRTLSWERTVDGLAFAVVEADAFCHHQVRAMIGALLFVGDGRRPVDWPATVLAKGVRDSAVTVAPAHGLTLERVGYPPDGELATQARATRRLRVLPDP